MSSEQELQMYRKYFLAQDKSGDGKLNRQEFKQMLKSMGLNFNDREITKAFNAVDRDNGGQITFNEFARQYLKKDKQNSYSHDRVKEVYRKVDRDKDGSLTKEECLEAMKMLGKHLDDRGLTRIMELMDTSNDGGISLSEFCKFCEL